MNKNTQLALIALLISIISLFAAVNAKACDEIFIKVGTGYKIDQPTFFNYEGKRYDLPTPESDKYTARIESGISCGKWTYGIAHHSQWLRGAPFNDLGEEYKTEIYIDYKFSWGI